LFITILIDYKYKMDAKYLSDNVNFALTEALTSMAVALPEDGVEYVGSYLLQFVERKNMIDMVSACL
jgi:hypothetical protein